MKVCILGATFTTGNMGVSMLAAGAIRCLLHRFPRAAIILFDYASEGYAFRFPFAGSDVPVRFVNIRFSKKTYLANNIAVLLLLAFLSRLVPSRRVRENLLSRNKTLKELVESDLVASVAYGDSFSDIYGMGRLIYIVLPQFLAVLTRKRLVFLPQTIGPFRSRLARAIATYILRHTEAVYSRDHVGLETTRALLGNGNSRTKLRFCYDLAFDVDPAAPKDLEIEGRLAPRADGVALVGFNVSGLLLAGGYTQDNMFGLKVGYEKLVHRMIDFLIEQKGAQILLVPHVFGPAGNLESDTHACEVVFASLRARHEGKIAFARGTYAYDEVKYVIGQCDFFVGARMHACIGALSQSVPTVPIAYSDKFRGMMQTIGCEHLVVDPRRLNEEEIVRILDRIYDQRGTLRVELQQKMPLVRGTIQNALCELEDSSGVDARTVQPVIASKLV